MADRPGVPVPDPELLDDGQVKVEERPEPPASVPDPERLDEVQERIEERLDTGAVEAAATELSELRPSDQAEVITELDETDRRALLGSLSADVLADIVEHMDVDDAVGLSGLIDVGRMAAVLDEGPPDVAADILRGIDWADAGQILARMRDRGSVADLLLYPDDDAGGLMTTDVAGIRAEWPAQHALSRLRQSDLDPENLQQLFVVDRGGVLLGHLSLSELVFAPSGARVRDVMHEDVISVQTDTDQEESARIMQRYELRSLPVVDSERRLQGAIAVEDLVQVAEEEATEDMYKIIGLGGEDRPLGPFLAAVRSRLPWLLVNLGTVLLAGFVLSLFEQTIDRLAILAVFLPVVMGQAGIAGTQTLTLIVRSLALGEVTTADTRRLLLREAALATAQWSTVCVLLGAVAWAWRQDVYLALVVGGAMALNLLVAAAAGVLVPLGMRAARIDPATSSVVVVTTLTDICGIAVYLGLATVFLTAFRVG